MDILRREFIYVWYYFSIQLEQIFGYWVLGMVLGSAISVFGKNKIHSAFSALGDKKLGVLGLIPASLLGIASSIFIKERVILTLEGLKHPKAGIQTPIYS